MRNNNPNPEHRNWAWLLLVGAAGLSAASLWLMASADESVWRGYGALTSLLRQGGYGLLALMLAWAVGQFSLHRPLLRHWYLFPALLLLVMLAAPVSVAIGSGRLIDGYGWWTRSVGVGAYLLALIFTASFVLPRFARGERGSSWTVAILIGLLVAIALFFLKRWGITVVGLAMFASACVIVLPRRKLAHALIGLAIAGGAAVLVKFAFAPEAMQRMLNLSFENSENFQLRQALLAIHSGGLLGWGSQPVWIPEWHTDFMFAHLCGGSGWLGGLAVLAAIGMMFTVACRIAMRQEDLRARTLASACAAAFVLPALLHVAVNLGLCPTLGIHFPFLSFAPNLLLLNGLLLGLLLSLACEPFVRSEENSGQAEVSQSRWPFALVFILIWGLTGLFALRIGTLVYAAPHLKELRQGQIERAADSQRQSIPLPRGRILDVNGRVLAHNVLSFWVCADPQLLIETGGLDSLPELARLIGMDEDALAARITTSSRRYLRLLRDVPPAIAEAVRHMKQPGIFVETVPTREYPENVPLAHLSGFVIWEELQGGGGVELIHNQELANGQDIHLTLNVDWQSSVQDIAEVAAAKTKAKQVRIIVMNPQTGAIRAAAQIPAAHGGASAKADAFALNWRAAVDLFEPGGLLMPLVLASALEAEVITIQTQIDCENGAWNYHGIPLRDARPFGNLRPDEIVAYASNIGMAKIGLLMGQQALYDSLLQWGLTERCSVGGFRGVPSGRLDPPSRWSELEITRIPIGHACAFTLLQVMRAYTSFFNKGTSVEPYLVETGALTASNSLLIPETAASLRTILVKAVESGTGQAARIDGITVFGKTAVVQKPMSDRRGYSPDKVQTAFVGGFERDGFEPLLIAVWLDEPEREARFNPAPGIFHEVAVSLTRLIAPEHPD